MKRHITIEFDDQNKLEVKKQIGCVRLLFAIFNVTKIKIKRKKVLDKQPISATTSGIM